MSYIIYECYLLLHSVLEIVWINGQTRHVARHAQQHTASVNGGQKIPNGFVTRIRISTRGIENYETIKCMEMYGVNNVRGGSYSKITLTSSERKSIEQQIRHNNGLCLRCGRKGHYANHCSQSKNTDASLFIDESGDNKEEVEENNKTLIARVQNTRWTTVNLVLQTITTMVQSITTGIMGYRYYSLSPFGVNDPEQGKAVPVSCSHISRNDYSGDASQDKILHTTRYNIADESEQKQMKKVDKVALRVIRTSESKCIRCGRTNHSSDQCYAVSHKNGYKLNNKSKAFPRRNNIAVPSKVRKYVAGCVHCGRNTHNTDECLLKMYADECKLDDTSRNGIVKHDNTVNRTVGQIKMSGCARCGRHNHISEECYATTHSDGYKLKRKE
jgi:hypothetical protein